MPTPIESSVLQSQLPISAYELTAAQSADEQYVLRFLSKQCMASFGFDYDTALSRDSMAQSVRISEEFESRWYGVSDPAAAARYGYHLPTWVQGSAAPKSINKLPAAETAVFTGSVHTYRGREVPTGGCLAEATNELVRAVAGASGRQDGIGDDSTSLVGQIQTNAFEQAQADPRVLAVFAKWSACMRSYGYDYATPFLAAADSRWISSPQASAVEVQTAERDIACKLRTNVLGVEFAIVSDYQNSAIARNAQRMRAIKEQVAAEVAAIRAQMLKIRA